MTEYRNVHRFDWAHRQDAVDWMLERVRDMKIPDLIDAFEKEFDYRLTVDQARSFKHSRGIKKEGTRGPTCGIGAERMKGGYVYVKVSDELGDYRKNWRSKAVVEWEKANGRSLPDGCKVMFVDGDRMNFDPDNLMAVSKAQASALPRLLSGGATYSNREELEALLAISCLDSAIVEARNRPKTCKVCGKTFVPNDRYNEQGSCKECRDAGKRAPAVRRRSVTCGRGVCAKCGREFDKYNRVQKLCPECSAKRKGRKAYQEWKEKNG